MTRTFTSILLACTTLTGYSQTCTPDQLYLGAAPGIYPTTALVPNCNLIAAKTISALTDTLVPSPLGGDIIVYIDAMRINSTVGIPAGLTFETDVMASADVNSPYGIWLNTGAIGSQAPALGCAFAYGTGGDWDNLLNGGPNNDGVYPIDFIVDARIAQTSPNVSFILPNGTWLSEAESLTGGAFPISTFLEVLPGYDTISATVSGNTNPNPFSGETYSVGANPNVAYNWSVTNGTITAGQGTNEVTVEWDGSPTGNISVDLTDGGCFGTSDLDVNVNPVGIAGSELSTISIWPNPSNGVFNVNGLEPGAVVDVRTVDGRTIFSTTAVASNATLILSEQPAGIYLLQVSSNSSILNKRLIKH